MNPDLDIRVSVYRPLGAQPLHVGIRMEKSIYDEAFAPLPEDRELFFAPHMRALAMRDKRRKWAAELGKQLADHILKLIEAEDPQFGYSPDQWREIKQGDSFTPTKTKNGPVKEDQ